MDEERESVIRSAETGKPLTRAEFDAMHARYLSELVSDAELAAALDSAAPHLRLSFLNILLSHLNVAGRQWYRAANPPESVPMPVFTAHIEFVETITNEIGEELSGDSRRFPRSNMFTMLRSIAEMYGVTGRLDDSLRLAQNRLIPPPSAND
jgi:hypothetical protein